MCGWQVPQSATQPRKTLLKWPRLTEDDKEEPEGHKHLDPDRPHPPETSTAVGKGRIVLESGLYRQREGILVHLSVLSGSASAPDSKVFS
jgi:hypothetical protein